jgi:hypothetical protein
MRIALVSFYAVTNIGDKILTDCVSKMLTDWGHSVKIVDINGRSIIYDSDSEDIRIAKKHISEQIKKNRKKYIEHFNKELCSCDLVIFAGGAILDLKSDYVAENIFTIVKVAENMNIPVAFNSVGFFGNDINGADGRFIRDALLSPNVKWLSVRERADDMMHILKGEKNFSVCCDPAVWAKNVYSPISLPSYTHKYLSNKRVIGLNPIYDSAFSLTRKEKIDIKKIYYGLYLYLTERGCKCLFFINGPQRDVEFINSFKEQYGIPSGSFLNNEITRDGKLFLSTLSQFSLVISSRLHTSICCYSLKIPTLSISWDKKINEFYGNIGRKKWILDENDISKISDKIENALATGYDVSHYDAYNNTVKLFLKTVLNEIDK